MKSFKIEKNDTASLLSRHETYWLDKILWCVTSTDRCILGLGDL